MDPSSEGPAVRPTRAISRADSTNENSNQFKATQTWNRIANEFREKMPTKKRWRQLKSFENSFTGKEAADFMLSILPALLPNKKEVTRESSVSLLQKFADQHLFKYAWTAEKTVFQDNATLYVWCGDTTLNGLCRTPVLVRRANSFNNGSADRPKRQPPPTPKAPHIKSPDTWKTFELPKSPPRHKPSRNRRLSSSTGNLSLIGVEKFEPILSPRFGDRDAIMEEVLSPDRREAGYGEIKRETRPEDGEVKRVQKKDVYGEVKKKKEPVYVTAATSKKNDSSEQENAPPTPSLVRSSPVYASYTKREAKSDFEKENNYDYVTFRRKNGMHSSPPKGTKKGGVQSAKEKRDNESTQTRSVFSRLTPSRFKAKEIERSPPHPPAPPPSTSMTRREDPIYSSIRIRQRPAVTESDEWNVYSTALVNRVRSLLGNSEENVITWRVDGQHVKWSCEYHSIGKVVPAMRQTDEWPSTLTQHMEYLRHFPFHSKHVNVITYTEQLEMKVFRTVVAQFKQFPPLLPASIGHAFLRVIGHFKRLSPPLSRPASANSGSSSVRVETAFSVGSPTTRLLPQTSASSLNESHMTDDIYATPGPSQSRVTLTAGTIPFIDSLIPTTLTHRHTVHSTPPQGGPLRVDPKSGMKARDILMEPLERERILNLPGLKHSPDLMERIKKLSPRISAIPFSLDTVTRQDGYQVPPALEGISMEMEPAVYESLQLILLSLPVGTRRKLQLLIKFINGISANHCLALQEHRENRYVALEAFCDCILTANDEYSIDAPLSHSDRIILVSMLIDNEIRLFSIPDDFAARVKNVLIERRRTKLEYDDSSPSMAPPAPQYCQRIQPEVFSAQMADTACSLRSLLDNIVSSTKMSNSEREKKLKAFEKNYPSIFYERFPERLHKKQEGGFLQKIFRTRND
ncbi:hypothetical protein PFISCL1PPCAC_5988 [Pristionchus fissidentatus]|uniref:DEP domain-containing protein n=1 Tax=Pristionchus fissidentatus TaxID=1538716 RepID=A0AAV5V7L3_9BILA|nr:hypothetical protein PFISCL1PPCAC_5988 [Pristionchus fissidentatus]